MARRATTTTSIHAAKTNLSKLVERATAGEEVIIARGQTPVARLIPIRPRKTGRKFGAMRGRAGTTAAFFEPLPQDELTRWQG